MVRRSGRGNLVTLAPRVREALATAIAHGDFWRVDAADGGENLQPVHLFQVLMVRLQTCLFALVVALPLAINLLGGDGANPAAENRALASFPRLEPSLASISSYPAGLVAWFEDHFGLRARLVRWHAGSRWFWLGMSPSPTVLRGGDGWLFYGDDGGVDDYANASALTDEELGAWRDATKRARRWAAAHGVAYVFTIVPDKHAIYPERFPRTIRKVQARSRTDQVLGALGDCDWAVDVRPALLAAKTGERVYHMTDTHWNDRGAFEAYRVLIEAVRAQNPSVPEAWTRSDFVAVSHRTDGGDLAGMMGLTRSLHEHDLALQPSRPRQARVVEPPGAQPTDELGRIVTEIPGSRLPRAVVFRDSFSSALVPFLSEHFSRVVYLWQNDFLTDVVLEERADVVIQEIVGRHLYTFIPTPELVPQ